MDEENDNQNLNKLVDKLRLVNVICDNNNNNNQTTTTTKIQTTKRTNGKENNML